MDRLGQSEIPGSRLPVVSALASPFSPPWKDLRSRPSSLPGDSTAAKAFPPAHRRSAVLRNMNVSRRFYVLQILALCCFLALRSAPQKVCC
ncbi:hypothetical protein DICSQDRAFT_134982 [Dichomitus squalens LYAD-421 SS1]|uniref:uncharacterized protein n=1 Tax=Dichomitus squalens (strain LYAD-421) TaxID=732165 RepID=UPI00044139CD|nr:uncharacterized protein DICSQDRAFT_134982 [Dichomitus squalens LYAD-421 SS1]EJF63528.1 hypothetical protein DICSQDRAFT_134982 [Dichomitus squalens LYAD-421 SS1]